MGGGAALAAGAEAHFARAQGVALAGEFEALLGDVVLLGAADEVEEFCGGSDIRLRLDERGIGEVPGAIDGGRIEVAGRQAGNGLRRCRLLLVEMRLNVAAVEADHGGAAHGNTEVLAQAGGDFGVGEIFVVEPEEELLVLLGGQLLEPGIGADFAGGSERGLGRHGNGLSVLCFGEQGMKNMPFPTLPSLPLYIDFPRQLLEGTGRT